MARTMLCVDIGNSGLRVAQLREDWTAVSPISLPSSDENSLAAGLADERASASVDTSAWPFTGEVIRIDWWLEPSAQSTPTTDSNNHARSDSATKPKPRSGCFRPDDHEWTRELGRKLNDSLARYLSSSRSVLWCISSVQRAAESRLREYVESRGDSECCIVDRQDLQLEVDVKFPERVGIDRLLAAAAAMSCTQSRPLIVIQAGSAITVDWVEAPNKFAGGAIIPGVPMMLRLLSQAADLLPQVAADELIELPSLPGKETSAAMACGVSSAVVGGVLHLIDRYRENARLAGMNTPLVVLSGGDGPRLARHLKPPVLEIDHLVLRGLAEVALRKANT